MVNKHPVFSIHKSIFREYSEDAIEDLIKNNPSFTIVRIFERGNMEAISKMTDYYGWEKTRETLRTELSDRNTLFINLAKVIFGLKKKSDFVCLKEKQYHMI